MDADIIIEGDRRKWHIRLVKQMVPGNPEFDAWALFNGDRQESSLWPKATVKQWLDEELVKEKNA